MLLSVNIHVFIGLSIYRFILGSESAEIFRIIMVSRILKVVKLCVVCCGGVGRMADHANL